MVKNSKEDLNEIESESKQESKEIKEFNLEEKIKIYKNLSRMYIKSKQKLTASQFIALLKI